MERATSGGKGRGEGGRQEFIVMQHPRRGSPLLAGTIVESMGFDQIKRVVFFIHSEIPRNPRSDEENGRLSGRLLESTNCPLFLLFFPLKRYERKGRGKGGYSRRINVMILFYFFFIEKKLKVNGWIVCFFESRGTCS